MNILERTWGWIDGQTEISKLIRPLMEHPAPRKVTWMYVLGSGTLFAFTLQAVTGIMLLSTYVPAGGAAYQSVLYITHDATLGKVLRGTHYFGASAMIVLVGLHMTRVFLTGSFKFPRQLNWLTGSVLLLLTLGQGFTGEVMRWDQTSVWATVIAVQMAGRTPFIGTWVGRFLLAGDTISAATLGRFFLYHVMIIPGSIIAILGLHLYLVIHNGISEPPKVGEKVDRKNYRAKYKKLVEEGGVPFWPDIAWRDVVFAFIVIVGVVIIANLFNPHPLSKPPDPSIIDAVPRPDWWLLWDFAVLALMPPGIENIVMIGSILALVVALFSLPFLAPYGERHPARRPLSVAFVVVVMTVIGVLTMAGAKARWSPAFDAKPLPESVIGASSGQVYEGGQLFYQRGCEYCHTVDGYGGTRGPNLSTIGNQRTTPELTIRILNGGINMPAFASVLDPSEVEALVAFLESRRSY